MFSLMSTYFDEIFSKYQYRFTKGYITLPVDKGKVFTALLTDFSKTPDCLNHELLIAKVNVYGFTLPALQVVHDYLPDRKQ